MITSGENPDSVNGISSVGHRMDMTPFCPCREENLSPITGFRGNRSVMLTRDSGNRSTPSRPSNRTVSTQALSDSLCFRASRKAGREQSRSSVTTGTASQARSGKKTKRVVTGKSSRAESCCPLDVKGAVNVPYLPLALTMSLRTAIT